MLFWHKHNIEKSLADLPNFTPFPDEWTVEDKVLFEQAFSFHGKTFHRIQQMVSGVVGVEKQSRWLDIVFSADCAELLSNAFGREQAKGMLEERSYRGWKETTLFPQSL